MKKCERCGRIYEDILAVCLKCNKPLVEIENNSAIRDDVPPQQAEEIRGKRIDKKQVLTDTLDKGNKAMDVLETFDSIMGFLSR